MLFFFGEIISCLFSSFQFLLCGLDCLISYVKKLVVAGDVILILLYHTDNLFADYEILTVSTLAYCYGFQTTFEARISAFRKRVSVNLLSLRNITMRRKLYRIRRNSRAFLNESLHKLSQPLKVHPRAHLKRRE